MVAAVAVIIGEKYRGRRSVSFAISVSKAVEHRGKRSGSGSIAWRK